MPKWIDLTGQRFGHLTALDWHPRFQQKGQWRCLCDCGQEVYVQSSNLRSGGTRTCGCRPSNYTHGKTDTRIYHIWTLMKYRCLKPNRPDYRHYGARGIRVCDRWLSFENFYADMGDPPPGMSLDRIDNDGDYCPENCRWATDQEQHQNRRDNVNIEFAGKRQCLSAWARTLGVPMTTLYRQARRTSPEAAVAQFAHSQEEAPHA